MCVCVLCMVGIARKGELLASCFSVRYADRYLLEEFPSTSHSTPLSLTYMQISRKRSRLTSSIFLCEARGVSEGKVLVYVSPSVSSSSSSSLSFELLRDLTLSHLNCLSNEDRGKKPSSLSFSRTSKSFLLFSCRIRMTNI